MARKKADRASPATEQLSAAQADPVAVEPMPATQTASEPSAPEQPAKEPQHANDPRSVMGANLSGQPDGPLMRLLRSQKFNQMQIQFDGGQPDEQYLARLRQDGWKDRTKSEGVWTKQIDRDARWQSVDKMEREFKAVANAIRKDKGMEPVLEGYAMG